MRRPLTLVALVAILLGAALGLGKLATPECRNQRGTARDSGYPCRVERSSGATDFVLSRTWTISVPLAGGVAIGLVVLGVVGLKRSSRQR